MPLLLRLRPRGASLPSSLQDDIPEAGHVSQDHQLSDRIFLAPRFLGGLLLLEAGRDILPNLGLDVWP